MAESKKQSVCGSFLSKTVPKEYNDPFSIDESQLYGIRVGENKHSLILPASGVYKIEVAILGNTWLDDGGDQGGKATVTDTYFAVRIDGSIYYSLVYMRDGSTRTRSTFYLQACKGAKLDLIFKDKAPKGCRSLFQSISPAWMNGNIELMPQFKYDEVALTESVTAKERGSAELTVAGTIESDKDESLAKQKQKDESLEKQKQKDE